METELILTFIFCVLAIIACIAWLIHEIRWRKKFWSEFDETQNYLDKELDRLCKKKNEERISKGKPPSQRRNRYGRKT